MGSVDTDVLVLFFMWREVKLWTTVNFAHLKLSVAAFWQLNASLLTIKSSSMNVKIFVLFSLNIFIQTGTGIILQILQPKLPQANISKTTHSVSLLLTLGQGAVCVFINREI